MNSTNGSLPEYLNVHASPKRRKSNKVPYLLAIFLVLLMFPLSYFGYKLLYKTNTQIIPDQPGAVPVDELPKEAKYISSLKSDLGLYEDWALSIVQPNIVRVEEIENTTYLVGEIQTESNSYELKFFLVGELGENASIHSVRYINSAGNADKLNSMQLKEKLLSGQRISVSYLSSVPEDFRNTDICVADPEICVLSSYYLDNPTEVVTLNNLENTANSSSVFVVFSLSEILVYE